MPAPFRLRPLLRALHRDFGYFAVGLTVVYAASGLAVNHLADWDPSFENYEVVHQLEPATFALAPDDDARARLVLAALGHDATGMEAFALSETELEVTLERKTLHVDVSTGRVVEEGQEPRPLLRVWNWLHLNRGKKAWTYVADAYAVCLLFLAGSGLFMLPGKKGLVGRGGLLVAFGAVIPFVYVAMVEGP